MATVAATWRWVIAAVVVWAFGVGGIQAQPGGLPCLWRDYLGHVEWDRHAEHVAYDAELVYVASRGVLRLAEVTAKEPSTAETFLPF